MAESLKYNEIELVSLLKQRTQSAFNYLYDNYSSALYTVIVSVLQDKELANDILQEVFIKIWRQIDQYNPDKGRLFTWMVNISRNASIDTLRSKSYNTQKQNRELTETVYSAAGTTSMETDKIGLRKIITRLKEDQKVLVELAYFEGYTQDEISKILNIPLGTVKTRLRSALINLREVFKKIMDIKSYIESGIIESYVLGLSTPEENLELEMLSVQYPEVRQAVLDFELLFEKEVNAELVQPPLNVKSNLLNILDKDFTAPAPVKQITSSTNDDTTRVRKINNSNYVAAASVILLIISTSLNFYFYSNIKNTTDRYEALLNERNTLQANNASYKTELNDLNKSFEIIKSPFVKDIAMNSVKPNEESHATIYWDTRTKEVYLLANNMNKVPQGKQYQLWAIVDGKPVDAGIVGFDCNGLCKMKVIPNAQAFAVTVEKEGGSPTPTLSTMVVLGKVS